MRPHLWMGGVRLLVATGDLERARDVLAVTEQPLSDEAPPGS